MPTSNRNSEADATNARRAPLASISDCEAPPDKGLIEREGAPCVPRWDANLYATKKSVAQGMMDIALLTANACQLKYVLREEEENSRFFFIQYQLHRNFHQPAGHCWNSSDPQYTL
ncbi:uncharacterized protein LOC106457761 isoform X1 [Limulus polyphemus]|uniref:Uncharacterized protein LOC106457761 isoform X1 n=1 Tax=Limulus polyphemus TaxID=6850 RepID=A0ABM1B157_LIMPO|nr:uncharacterized protein LOC106457761 isoform X1 [Limulus polyphemus]